MAVLPLSLLLLPLALVGGEPVSDPIVIAAAARVRLTTPKTDDRPLWRDLHAAHLERARQGGIRVLFIGDSLTHFWSEEGAAAWERGLAPLGAAQFGIPGDHCATLLGRLRPELAALGAPPDQVVLLFGTNNVIAAPTHAPGEAVAYALAHIIDVIRSTLPTARLTVVSVLPRRATEPHVRVHTAAVNATLAAQATAQGYRFLDLHAAFADPADPGLGDARWLKDEVHLNAAGYDRYLELLLPALR
jgi:lysophospholipase L1-like esterase